MEGKEINSAPVGGSRLVSGGVSRDSLRVERSIGRREESSSKRRLWRRRSLLRTLALVLVAASVPAAGVAPGPVAAEDDPIDITLIKVTSVGARTFDVIELDYDHGPFPPGELLPLIKVSGGRRALPEAIREDGSGCPDFHRHSSDDLFICDPSLPEGNRFGPFQDKAKRNCGHGIETTALAELEVSVAYFPGLFLVPAFYYLEITNVGELFFDGVKLDVTLEFPNKTQTLSRDRFTSLAPGESTQSLLAAFASGENGALAIFSSFVNVGIDPNGNFVPVDELNLGELGDVAPPTRASFKATGLIDGCKETASVDVTAKVDSRTINIDPSDFSMKQAYTGSLQAPSQSPQLVTVQLGGAALVTLDGPRITSYTSDGTGGFRFDRVIHTTQEEPIHIHRADINDDGVADLVRIDLLKASFNVTFGQREPVQGNVEDDFQQMADTPQAVGAILATAVGDVNGDRTDDLILIDQSGVATVMRLNRDGSLAGTTMTDLGTGPIDSAVVTSSDLNGDAFRDIAVAVTPNTAPAGGRVAIFSGSAGGSLSFRQSVALGGIPSAVATGDLNRDGRQEVMVADGRAHTITILRNDGTGGLSTGTTFLSGGLGPVALAAADVNGDGDLDLVAANRVSSNVSMFLGDGNNHLFLSRLIPTPRGLGIVAPFDFNNDGKVDIAVGYTGVSSSQSPQAIDLNEDDSPQPAGFTIFLNGAQPVVRPVVQKVEPQGKHLIVTCSNCAGGAKVLVDGIQKKTIPEDVGRLRAKKAFKQLTAGQSALVQVESDGRLSEWFRFTK